LFWYSSNEKTKPTYRGKTFQHIFLDGSGPPLKTKSLFPKIDKTREQKSQGCAPHFLLTRLRPFPPSQVGAKCPVVVVLNNQDRALRQGFHNILQLGDASRTLIRVTGLIHMCNVIYFCM